MEMNESILQFVFWNAAGFMLALTYGSFAEWTLHRFVMHRKTILEYPYRKHAVQHHGLFGADETYHAQNDEMKGHIKFVFMDYAFISLVLLPLHWGVESLFGKPMILGAILATLCYLQAFNTLHLFFHLPKERRIEKWRAFLFMKRHHLLHHESHLCNVNVVLPLADVVLGTLRTRPLNENAVLKIM